MSEKFREHHTCGNCGGEIIVTKIRVTGIGPNQSQPIESVASVRPCSVCGSTMNINGYEFDSKKRNKK